MSSGSPTSADRKASHNERSFLRSRRDPRPCGVVHRRWVIDCRATRDTTHFTTGRAGDWSVGRRRWRRRGSQPAAIATLRRNRNPCDRMDSLPGFHPCARWKVRPAGPRPPGGCRDRGICRVCLGCRDQIARTATPSRPPGRTTLAPIPSRQPDGQGLGDSPSRGGRPWSRASQSLCLVCRSARQLQRQLPELSRVECLKPSGL
jgi:hypothetical protein